MAGIEETRRLLYRAIRELAYVQSASCGHTCLCASSNGEEIIAEGNALLGVKDLAADEYPAGKQ